MDNRLQILKTLTLLYAEDDPIVRENISKTLAIFVNKVITLKDGAEAIEMFHNRAIHIVILDYVMPLVDGNSVAMNIRKSDHLIPILMLSSHADKDKLMNAIKTGITEYLEKPLNFDKLYAALMNAVGKLIDAGRLMVRLADDIEYNYVEKILHTPTTSERLTKNEYQFLEMLLQYPKSLILKEEIEQRVFEGDVDPNTLRNMVYRLRKKIPADIIITIKDLGYMFHPL